MKSIITTKIAKYTNEALLSLDNLTFFTDAEIRDTVLWHVEILEDWGDIRSRENVIEEDLVEVCPNPQDMQQYFSLMLAQMPRVTILDKYDERIEVYKDRFGTEAAKRAETLIEWLGIALDGLWHSLMQVGEKYGLENTCEDLREDFGMTAKQEAAESTEQKSKRRRGRPSETFKDKMVNDEDGSKLRRIHALIRGKKGKDAVLVLLACVLEGWTGRPTYTQVRNEFGDIGSKTGYNRYLKATMFTKEEIEGAKNALSCQ